MIKNYLKKNIQYYKYSTYRGAQQQGSIARGIDRAPYNLKEGDIINNFKVNKIDYIEDFKIKTYQLTHTSNLEYIHFDTPDLNNCMAIIFKTLPENSKGLPHILEHMACCGSEKYPVRDPFFKMLNRSLNTYMNALTGGDFTAYPFSTKNLKDFQNLRSVYLDIALRSLLREQDFKQEGWRYDLEDGKMQYKGIVFNEMKGVYQSSDAIFTENLNKNLYKGSVYSHSSGGDPAEITDLTYQELREFHSKYYNPSNAKVYSYGDLDFRENLEYLDRNYLQGQGSRVINYDQQVLTPKRGSDTFFIEGPTDPVRQPGKEIKYAVSYLCNDIQGDVIETQGLSLLHMLLCDPPTGALYKSLIESGIAPAFGPGNGFDAYNRQSSFTLSVQNIGQEDIPECDSIIQQCIKDVISNGFDKNLIESYLHQMEISNKKPSPNFGFSILMSIFGIMNHGGQVLDSLRIGKTISTLRQKIYEEEFLQQLAKKYLLENTHCVKLVMKPNEKFNEILIENEKKKLEKIAVQMTEEERQKIILDNQKLTALQDLKEDLSVLPKIGLEDIELGVERCDVYLDGGILKPDLTPKAKTNDWGTVISDPTPTPDPTSISNSKPPIYFVPQNINGLSYLRLKINVLEPNEFLNQYSRIFTHIIERLGTKKNNKEEFNKLIYQYTGGVSIHMDSGCDKSDVYKVNQYIVFEVSCIDRNIGKMFELLEELFVEYNLYEENYIKTIVLNYQSEVSNDIIQSGLEYAINSAGATLRKNYSLLDPLQQTRKICELSSDLVNLPHFLDAFQQNMELLKTYPIEYVVHSDAGNQKKFEELIGQMHGKIQTSRYQIEGRDKRFVRKYSKLFFKLPMQVNFCVQSHEIGPFMSKDRPNLQIISQLMSNIVLHKEIREKGGAYGSGCRIGEGVLNFFSYRDPNVDKTFSAFNMAVQEVIGGNFDEDDIKDAKINIFQKMDKIVLPQNKGLQKITRRIFEEEVERHRQVVIGANKSELIDVAQKVLGFQIHQGMFTKCVFGPNILNEQDMKQNEWEIQDAL